METLNAIFGVQDHLAWYQECARAVLIFAYGLLMMRLSGKRTFVQWSAVDLVISFIVGSSLARALTGSAPMAGTLAAVAVLILLHALVAHWVARSTRAARILEGRAVPLIDHGRIDHAARRAHMISEADLAAALRRQGVDAETGLANVKSVTLEPNGELSVVKREPCKPDLS